MPIKSMAGGYSSEKFIAYVRENHAGLRAFVRSLGVSPMWVDDLAQEALVIAYERMDDFDENRDFGAWVRGIARNLVINERRKDARRKRILSDNLTEVLLSSSSVPENEPEEKGDRAQAKVAALRECLKLVPEKSRALIQAKYEAEQSAPDIAAKLNMTSAAVRKSLERVRTALRKCMEERLQNVNVG